MSNEQRPPATPRNRTIIPAHNGKYVVKTVTPEGVTAYCASDVPREALEGLMAKLLKRREKLRKQK